jgi:hypothetical protein
MVDELEKVENLRILSRDRFFVIIDTAVTKGGWKKQRSKISCQGPFNESFHLNVSFLYIFNSYQNIHNF